MPFKNPVLAGDFLARPVAQSPDYSPGVSGWALFRNGSAEFNDGVFRGSVSVGNPAAQHYVINNPITGDILDVYDTLNRLVYKIDINGVVWNLDPVGGFVMREEFGGIVFDTAGGVTVNGAISETFSGRADLNIASGHTAVGGGSAQIDVLGSTGAATHDETVTGTQRNGVTGSFVQSDQTGVNNLEHMQAVSGTTDASGFLVFPHGAGFTPTMIFTQAHGAGTPSFGTAVVIDGSIGATNAKVLCTNSNGTTRTNAAVTFWAWSKG